jgi:hypothetical protein
MNVLDAIDISTLSTGEKLGLMERLWQDLSKNPETIEIPEWHLKRLEDAEKGIADGTDEFIDVDEFEAELREKISQRRKR